MPFGQLGWLVRVLLVWPVCVNCVINHRWTMQAACGKGNAALLHAAPALGLLVCQFVADAAALVLAS
jgi:hypothetical protein